MSSAGEFGRLGFQVTLTDGHLQVRINLQLSSGDDTDGNYLIEEL